MTKWLFLSVAILAEVVATSALRSSEGFSKLVPSVVVLLGYGVAFYFLSLALRSIPVGIAYAVWSGWASCSSQSSAGSCTARSSMPGAWSEWA